MDPAAEFPDEQASTLAQNDTHTLRSTQSHPRQDDAGEMIGQRLGPYQVIEELGHGGMGIVYLAARADDQFRKSVAIKLVKRGMDTDEIVSRFRHERQILASLDHPNIARLLDGGAAPDGRPYFVMEYVQGMRIDEYCDRHRLSIADRVALFRDVCSAVQYAHQNLVVHRDLKPGNILITDEGVPKLLDFGIAKLMNPGLQDPAGYHLTAFGERPLTPAYASPEQWRREPVTTASDVYSLGVILYELLAGQRPFPETGETIEEFGRNIVSTDPLKPSSAVVERRDTGGASPEEIAKARRIAEPARLRRKLAGDLDNIVLMAMRKDPRRRYAHASQLGDDLSRYLQGRPVMARGDGFRYRAAKFLQRHKATAVAGAAFLLLLIAFITTAVVQASRIRAERDKLARVSEFLAGLFKVADPGASRGNTVTARDLLDQGAARVGTELRGQPEIQASLLNEMAQAYQGLGLYDRARDLYSQALAIRRNLSPRPNADTVVSMMGLARAQLALGAFDAAEPLIRESLETNRRLLGPEHENVAASLSLLGLYYYQRRDNRKAEPYLREAMAIQRKLRGDNDPGLAGMKSDLADVVQSSEEAEKLLREALAVERGAYGEGHPTVVSGLNNLAVILLRRKDLAGAEKTFRELVEAGRKLYGDENPHVALYMANLGFVLHSRKDLAGAEPLLRRALEIRKKTLPANSPEIGHSEVLLGRLLVDKGDAAGAEPLLRDVVAIFRQKFAPDSTYTADAESSLGACLLNLRKYPEADKLLTGSFATLESQGKVKSDLGRRIAANLVKLYEATGATGKSVRYREFLSASAH